MRTPAWDIDAFPYCPCCRGARTTTSRPASRLPSGTIAGAGGRGANRPSGGRWAAPLPDVHPADDRDHRRRALPRHPDWLFEIKLGRLSRGGGRQRRRRAALDRDRRTPRRYFPELRGPPDWMDARARPSSMARWSRSRQDGRRTSRLLQDPPARWARSGNRRAGKRRSRRHLSCSRAFDLLFLDGGSMLGVPLEDLKRRLRLGPAGPPPPSATRAHRGARASPSSVLRQTTSSRASSPSLAGGPVRAGPSFACLAEDQEPARAGVRRRRLGGRARAVARDLGSLVLGHLRDGRLSIRRGRWAAASTLRTRRTSGPHGRPRWGLPPVSDPPRLCRMLAPPLGRASRRPCRVRRLDPDGFHPAGRRPGHRARAGPDHVRPGAPDGPDARTAAEAPPSPRPRRPTPRSTKSTKLAAEEATPASRLLDRRPELMTLRRHSRRPREELAALDAGWVPLARGRSAATTSR